MDILAGEPQYVSGILRDSISDPAAATLSNYPSHGARPSVEPQTKDRIKKYRGATLDLDIS